mmetsp:Transcript_26879/g.55013  ORF Transcript_26879/g.55013 Transcript_26879/m.55013 type:complete len:247 (+) Transcript_26879:309-1049(+)
MVCGFRSCLALALVSSNSRAFSSARACPDPSSRFASTISAELCRSRCAFTSRWCRRLVSTLETALAAHESMSASMSSVRFKDFFLLLRRPSLTRTAPRSASALFSAALSSDSLPNFVGTGSPSLDVDSAFRSSAGLPLLGPLGPSFQERAFHERALSSFLGRAALRATFLRFGEFVRAFAAIVILNMPNFFPCWLPSTHAEHLGSAPNFSQSRCRIMRRSLETRCRSLLCSSLARFFKAMKARHTF